VCRTVSNILTVCSIASLHCTDILQITTFFLCFQTLQYLLVHVTSHHLIPFILPCKVDDLKNRLGLDAQSQKVDWGTLGVLGSESIAKLKYVIALEDVIKFFSFVCLIYVCLTGCMYACMCVYIYVSMNVSVHACIYDSCNFGCLFVCMYASCLKCVSTNQVHYDYLHLNDTTHVYYE
jgi:hypothetical protein